MLELNPALIYKKLNKIAHQERRLNFRLEFMYKLRITKILSERRKVDETR